MDNNIKERNIMVTLAGKYRGPYFEKIKILKKELIEKGIDVLYPPEGDMSDDKYGFFNDDKRTGDNSKDFARAEILFDNKTLQKCDAIIFCNYDGYIGRTTMKELYFFSALIASNYEKNQNDYYNYLDEYIPIYLLEKIDIDSLKNNDEIGNIASLLEYGIEKGLIKVGINSFYDDIENGQISNMKRKHHRK